MAGLQTRIGDKVADPRDREHHDATVWMVVLLAGLSTSVLAVAARADLGTDAPPFLLHYQPFVSPRLLFPLLVIAAVLWTATRRWAARLRWRGLLALSYLGSLSWLVSLALLRGADGLTRYVRDADGYTPPVDTTETISEILASLSQPDGHASTSVTGHPPGPAILLWSLKILPVSDLVAGLIWTGLAALTVPLVLLAARSACGRPAARRLAPVLILAPYALWMAVGPDAITAMLGAGALAAACLASDRHRRGWPAFGLALVAGLLLAAATLFAYIAAWLGLSMVCLYFARRRPWHNLATGAVALVPLLVAQAAGFDWATGLTEAYEGFLGRVEAGRSLWWWIPLSITVLVIACGPAVVAGFRKLRNTPGWPFLAGSCAAIVFSIVAGIARGGVEQTWLVFFPWLTIAATAPAVPGGRPLPAPLRLAAIGGMTAVVVGSVLVSPW
ncbi:MAG: hypothetical protein ACRD0P_07615 [Stackebrandtia sp.]